MVLNCFTIIKIKNLFKFNYFVIKAITTINIIIRKFSFITIIIKKCCFITIIKNALIKVIIIIVMIINNLLVYYYVIINKKTVNNVIVNFTINFKYYFIFTI